MNKSKEKIEPEKSIISGSCLCGLVHFEVDFQPERFYLCHCQQCQQLTGSAFAANIFTKPNNIEWLLGYEYISHYQHPTREFSKAFCSKCGSALPFVNKSGKALIIPAGSLSKALTDIPDANIFVSEKVKWLCSGLITPNFNHFPE